MFETAVTVTGSVVGTSLALWAHFSQVKNAKREVRKEQEAIRQLEMQKYADTAVKKYAAERDFNHIRNELAQLRENMKLLLTENEQLSDRVDHLKIEMQHIKGVHNGPDNR